MVALGAQIGASTHIQDQCMIPESFSPMKRTVSTPKKLTPPVVSLSPFIADFLHDLVNVFQRKLLEVAVIHAFELLAE